MSITALYDTFTAECMQRSIMCQIVYRVIALCCFMSGSVFLLLLTKANALHSFEDT